MPVSKARLVEKKLEFVVDEAEFTIGNEQVVVKGLKGAIDVSSILHSIVPEHIAPPIKRKGPVPGTGVYMHSFGTKKIQVIKETRGLTGLGLKEAKEMVEAAPLLIKAEELLPTYTMDEARQKLEEAGATVEIRTDQGDAVPPPPQPTVLNLIQKWLVKVSAPDTEE